MLEKFIGKAAHALLELTLVQAIRKDIVVNWNKAKLTWCHLPGHNLHVATLDHLLLLSHCPSAPTERGGL